MKRIDERPSYIFTASRSEMIVSVETPFPATVRVKVPAISAMAGARFVVNIDGTDYLTDYAVAEANRARSRISDRNSYFLDRIDSLKTIIKIYDAWVVMSEARSLDAEKLKRESKALFKKGVISESYYKSILKNVRSIYHSPSDLYYVLFKEFFPDEWTRLIYPETVRSLIQFAETEGNKSADLENIR